MEIRVFGMALEPDYAEISLCTRFLVWLENKKQWAKWMIENLIRAVCRGKAVTENGGSFAEVEFSATWLSLAHCTLSVVARSFQCRQRFIFSFAFYLHFMMLLRFLWCIIADSRVMPKRRKICRHRNKLKPKLTRIINSRTLFCQQLSFANLILIAALAHLAPSKPFIEPYRVPNLKSKRSIGEMSWSLAPTFVCNSSFASFSPFPYLNLTLECFANGRPSEVIKILIEIRRIAKVNGEIEIISFLRMPNEVRSLSLVSKFYF